MNTTYKIMFGLFGLFFLNACKPIQAYWLLTKTSSQSNFKEELTFRLSEGLVVLEVVINSQKYEFVMDTGAALSVMDSSLSEQIFEKEKLQIAITDAHGTRKKMAIYELDSLKIGEVLFQKIAFLSSQSNLFKQIGVHGIIGANILKHAHWKIDFEHKQLSLSDSILDEKNVLYTPFKKRLGLPYLQIDYKNSRLKNVLFDIGYNGNLDIPLRKAQKNTHLKGFLKTHYQEILNQESLFGQKDIVCFMTTLDSLRTGNFYLKNTPIIIGKDNNLKIGIEPFRKNSLFLDYENNRIGIR